MWFWILVFLGVAMAPVAEEAGQSCLRFTTLCGDPAAYPPHRRLSERACLSYDDVVHIDDDVLENLLQLVPATSTDKHTFVCEAFDEPYMFQLQRKPIETQDKCTYRGGFIFNASIWRRETLLMKDIDFTTSDCSAYLHAYGFSYRPELERFTGFSGEREYGSFYHSIEPQVGMDGLSPLLEMPLSQTMIRDELLHNYSDRYRNR